MPATAQAIAAAFRLYVDKADSQGAADFLLLEQQQFLNDAQVTLARSVVKGKSDDQDAVELRRTLSTPTTLIFTGGTADLPSNFLSHGRLVVTPPNYGGFPIPVSVVSEDELANALQDPFNKPTLGTPIGAYLHNQLLLYPDTLTAATLSYYKLPAPLDVTSPTSTTDFPDSLVHLLVQKAVQLALESVADPRFQTQSAIATLTQNA